MRQALANGRYLNDYCDAGDAEYGPDLQGHAWIQWGRITINFRWNKGWMVIENITIIKNPKLLATACRKDPFALSSDALPGIKFFDFMVGPIATDINCNETLAKCRNICNSDKRCAPSEFIIQ